MSDDIIWALDQRERCIACPAKPVANAVVLHLSEDGTLVRDAVARWAVDGVMAAGVAWPGATGDLDDDDWLDLEDAASGLDGLATVVAVVADGDAARIAEELGHRVPGLAYAGSADRPRVLDVLLQAAPV